MCSNLTASADGCIGCFTNVMVCWEFFVCQSVIYSVSLFSVQMNLIIIPIVNNNICSFLSVAKDSAAYQPP